jgi:RHS repeat-associated protein
VEVYTTPEGGGTQVQRFDAWGNQTQSAGAAIPQYGYTGREPDGTGLIYYRARYYDPTIGRFISRDPAGMPDGVNRYVYVGNDPVNGTDPTGMVEANLIPFVSQAKMAWDWASNKVSRATEIARQTGRSADALALQLSGGVKD